jgi:hypothetical protein
MFALGEGDRLPTERCVVRYALLILSVALAGCAGNPAGNDAQTYPGFFGQYVIGSETYVSVSNAYTETNALPLADAHCAKFGKVARFNHREQADEQVSVIFDCVERQ